MEFKGKLESYRDKQMLVTIPDGFDIKEIMSKSKNGDLIVDFYEKDTITDLQRNHFYALVGDWNEYSGDPRDAIEDYLKYKFMKKEGLDEFPSLARNKMKKTTASSLLEFTIDFYIRKGIPFRKQQFYLTMDTSKMLYALVMKRLCWVCGKPNSDIHHVNGSTIGMGNDRRKVNHVGRYVLCLCRQHHSEIHTLGEEKFLKLHHLAPIKLNEETIKDLKIGG